MHRSLEEICESLASAAAASARVTAVAVYSETDGNLELVARKGDNPFPLRISLKEIKTHNNNKRKMVPSRALTPGLLCIPINGIAEVRGLLIVRGRMGMGQIRRFRILAGHTGLSLDSFHSQTRLQAEAYLDELTGLFNRRYFEVAFSTGLKLFQTKQKPMALLFMDVDHFKRFNDANGHDSGDGILKTLGSLLRDEASVRGTAFRWGGEEFALILPDTELTDALARAESLRKRFKHLVSENTPQLSISIGVSLAPHCGSTGQELLRAADVALYEAKTTRDCTRLSKQLATSQGFDMRAHELRSSRA